MAPDTESIRDFGHVSGRRLTIIRAIGDAGHIPPHGQVDVTIATTSLTLGSVTDQAKGAGYLDTSQHPTAQFTAEIVTRDGGHVAVGSLRIRETSVPVEMPFELTIEDKM